MCVSNIINSCLSKVECVQLIIKIHPFVYSHSKCAKDCGERIPKITFCKGCTKLNKHRPAFLRGPLFICLFLRLVEKFFQLTSFLCEHPRNSSTPKTTLTSPRPDFIIWDRIFRLLCVETITCPHRLTDFAKLALEWPTHFCLFFTGFHSTLTRSPTYKEFSRQFTLLLFICTNNC